MLENILFGSLYFQFNLIKDHMKIIKRLSLLSTIYHRTLKPKPQDPWLQRILYSSMQQQKKLTPEQQLIKYGYSTKPYRAGVNLALFSASIFFGFLLHIYLTTIYKNQLKVRNKYRVQEQEHSSIHLRARRFLLVIAEWAEKNLFFSEIMMQNETKSISSFSESLIRREQYKHYMKNKNRKFDFMDIGVVEKFPFPEIKD